MIEKTDSELKDDVLAELKYQPNVRISDIGVLVKGGTVTLNGYASSYGEKRAALHAVKQVAGVNGIADDIEVQLPNLPHCTDGDIASAAAKQIEWSPTILNNTVRVIVTHGWINLEGEVEWWYQKDSAEKLVEVLQGVRGVTNGISIRPSITTEELETVIRSALERNAVLDANRIDVSAIGSRVTLQGKVRNHAALEQAERIAWAAPGVTAVDNQITVKWSWSDN